MSIKSDKWIRRMAEQHGMIEPFEAGQVRVDSDNEKIVSYGTSSYGYDVRCADEFKIFTNINHAIVDPKAFDPASFVDLKSDTCIIPPNSFALARTVEYFRIPRSVLTVCLGKSTYARCFAADTQVALADGRSLSLEQMTRGAAEGERYYGYGVARFGKVIVQELEAPRLVGQDSLLEVTLDNDAVIRATPDHEFLMRDGTMLPAAELVQGSSLMPCYRSLRRGYEMTFQPLTGHMYPTHRLADEWNLRHGVYEDVEGTHRHHIDHQRTNNSPFNIMRVEASEHLSMHSAISYGEGFDAGEHGKSIRQSLTALRKNDQWYATLSQAAGNPCAAVLGTPMSIKFAQRSTRQAAFGEQRGCRGLIALFFAASRKSLRVCVANPWRTTKWPAFERSLAPMMCIALPLQRQETLHSRREFSSRIAELLST